MQRMDCCEAVALNSKDIAAMSIDLAIEPSGTVTFHFTETGVGPTVTVTARVPKPNHCHHDEQPPLISCYWLRVFPPPEFVWRPLWV